MKKHYHFVGIGGIGMGALASLLLDQGYTVSGSDLHENYVTDRLKKQGAKISVGHDAKNINGAQVLVYSSAVTRDNCELAAAQSKGINIIKRARLLADLMKGQFGITIAGAHGKTTTTSMISNLLIDAGLNPTTAVGGIVNGNGLHAQTGEGRYFVAEVDESDGSFLYFSPQLAVVTNIDKEHLDFYPTWEDIIKAYDQFIKNVDPKGCVIACGEDETLCRLLKNNKRSYKTYGVSAHNHIIAKAIMFQEGKTEFDCLVDGKKAGKINLRVPGQHNVLNALACIGVGLHLSVDFKVIQKALSQFQGVKRRLQIIGRNDDVAVMDDYAHHPTEIRATLKAVEYFKKKRLVVVFQPHRYTRLKGLMDEFAQSLTLSDYLVVTDIYAASEPPLEGITAQKLVEKVKKITTKPVFYVKKDKIIDHLLGAIQSGDLILNLGAGDITYIAHEFAKHLKCEVKL